MLPKIIRYIKDLPRVLDDYGSYATRPSEKTINNAIEFLNKINFIYLKKILPNECITPSSHGTIVIDWYYKKNLLSVEIGDDKIGWYSDLSDGSNPKSDGILLIEDENYIKQINDCLNKIYR